MTPQWYINEVLGPIVVPYVKSIKEGIFHQDNARPHIAHKL
jgi:hypothetical protein